MATQANALLKSRLLKAFGPSSVGFSFLKGVSTGKDDRLWSNVDATQRPYNHDQVITLTTTRTLLPKESGAKVILNSATSFTTTLPAPADGLDFTFIVKLVGASTGHVVAVTSGVVMYGKVSPTGAASAATSGKGRINTNATAVVGDGLRVWSDGTSWYSLPIGTWAEN